MVGGVHGLILVLVLLLEGGPKPGGPGGAWEIPGKHYQGGPSRAQEVNGGGPWSSLARRSQGPAGGPWPGSTSTSKEVQGTVCIQDHLWT